MTNNDQGSMGDVKPAEGIGDGRSGKCRSSKGEGLVPHAQPERVHNHAKCSISPRQ